MVRKGTGTCREKQELSMSETPGPSEVESTCPGPAGDTFPAPVQGAVLGCPHSKPSSSTFLEYICALNPKSLSEREVW